MAGVGLHAFDVDGAVCLAAAYHEPDGDGYRSSRWSRVTGEGPDPVAQGRPRSGRRGRGQGRRARPPCRPASPPAGTARRRCGAARRRAPEERADVALDHVAVRQREPKAVPVESGSAADPEHRCVDVDLDPVGFADARQAVPRYPRRPAGPRRPRPPGSSWSPGGTCPRRPAGSRSSAGRTAGRGSASNSGGRGPAPAG